MAERLLSIYSTTLTWEFPQIFVTEAVVFSLRVRQKHPRALIRFADVPYKGLLAPL